MISYYSSILFWKPAVWCVLWWMTHCLKCVLDVGLLIKCLKERLYPFTLSKFVYVEFLLSYFLHCSVYLFLFFDTVEKMGVMAKKWLSAFARASARGRGERMRALGFRTRSARRGVGRRRGGLHTVEGSEKSTYLTLRDRNSGPSLSQRTISYISELHRDYKTVRCSQTALLKCSCLRHFAGREQVRPFMGRWKGTSSPSY